jgi:hypothetical protein
MKLQNPPREHIRGRESHVEEAAEARAHPGSWFLFRELPKGHSKKEAAAARQMSANIKHGRYAAFRPDGAFESVSRLREDGALGVYVKYLGKDVEADAKIKAAEADIEIKAAEVRSATPRSLGKAKTAAKS